MRRLAGFFAASCPHCRSIDYRISDPRNVLETTVHWLLQPFWCSLCGHRFFLFSWQVPAGGAGAA